MKTYDITFCGVVTVTTIVEVSADSRQKAEEIAWKEIIDSITDQVWVVENNIPDIHDIEIVKE